MLDFLQPIFPFAFPILWISGTAALIFRQRFMYRAFMRQFPPGAFDNTLPEYSPWFGYSLGYARRLGESEQTTLPDPERERLRKAAVRSSILLFLWIFGFPLVTFCVAGFLTVVGLIHPH